MKYILKEIVSRNGLGADTYERYARWAFPKNVIIAFNTHDEAVAEGKNLINDPCNGIIDYKVERVK